MEKFLIDSCVLLEILLKQTQKEKCKRYLSKRIGNLFISDFSLHSIGIILFNLNKTDDFNSILDDIFPKFEVVTLPFIEYQKLSKIKLKYKLDFDDSYQTALADAYGFTIATLDKDYRKIAGDYKVEFVK